MVSEPYVVPSLAREGVLSRFSCSTRGRNCTSTKLQIWFVDHRQTSSPNQIFVVIAEFGGEESAHLPWMYASLLNHVLLYAVWLFLFARVYFPNRVFRCTQQVCSWRSVLTWHQYLLTWQTRGTLMCYTVTTAGLPECRSSLTWPDLFCWTIDWVRTDMGLDPTNIEPFFFPERLKILGFSAISLLTMATVIWTRGNWSPTRRRWLRAKSPATAANTKHWSVPFFFLFFFYKSSSDKSQYDVGPFSFSDDCNNRDPDLDLFSSDWKKEK